MPEWTLTPTETWLTIAGAVVLVLGVYLLADHGQQSLERFQEAVAKDLTYAEAMAFLDAPADHPEGMLTGLWGRNPGAEEWWWRCTFCREFDYHLSATAAALEASAHVCDPAALERAREDAKRQHPAFRDIRDEMNGV